MTQRTFRWLTILLAVGGLTADLGTKYGMFRWLYNDGRAADEGRFKVASVPGYAHRGEYDVIPGWFTFTAEFDHSVPTCDCGFKGLQTWSAPVMPRVNHGALFGLGGEHKGLANQVFAGVSIVAAAGILVWVSRRSTAVDGWLCAALGLILGGTIGNLFDRVVFNGVRDFLYFYRIDWPVFNVADCCLVVGAGMLLVHAFFPARAKDVPAAPTPAA